MSNETEMRAILQELHDKFGMRVYGTSSYIKKDMRDRIAAALVMPTQAPAATEAPSDWRSGIADLILHLHQWQAAPAGDESTAAWDRLQGTINALATPAPAVGASVQPVLVNLSDALLRAANYIDVLGGDSRKYRAALASPTPTKGGEACSDCKRREVYKTWPHRRPGCQQCAES